MRRPIPVPASNRPTDAFVQHHDVTEPQVDGEAFRQHWRVATKLDQLLAAKKIDREAYDTAAEFQRWARLIGISAVQKWEPRIDQSAFGNDAGAIHRTFAAQRLREAAEVLGPLRMRLLESCLLYDSKWAAIARLIGRGPETCRDWCCEAIAALSDWRSGRPVPVAPGLRRT